MCDYYLLFALFMLQLFYILVTVELVTYFLNFFVVNWCNVTCVNTS